MFDDFTETPLDGLFQTIEYPDELIHTPLKWISLKSAKKVLGIGDRQIQRYADSGKLERTYKTVKGHRKVYYSNRTVYMLRDELNYKRERALSDGITTEIRNYEIIGGIEGVTPQELMKLNEITKLLNKL